MAAALSLGSSTLTPKLSHSQTPISFSHSRTNLSFLSHSLSSLALGPCKQLASSFTVKFSDAEAAAAVSEPETESPGPEIEPESESAVETAEPKREEVFAVVMVGSRQYIVFPGRYIYVQRLKGADVNDKIKLNKVLLVGTKTQTYIGRPIVTNATVEAIVEEQTLDNKVVVFKYKKKKNYRRNIGHRQPITRIRVTCIKGYEDYQPQPVADLREVARTLLGDETELREFYEVMDAEHGHGEITYDQLKQGLRRVATKLTDAQITALISTDVVRRNEDNDSAAVGGNEVDSA